MTSLALVFYAIGLAGHATVEIVDRVFYALHDTGTPVKAASLAFGMNLGLSLVLMSTGMNYRGLALANSLAATRDGQPVLASICAAYVEVNDYAAEDLPILRQRMALILGEPALQAHSQVRYADIDRVVAEHVARRTGQSPEALLPRLVATSTRAAATTAFEVWLADGTTTLAADLRAAFGELATGFATLRAPS